MIAAIIVAAGRGLRMGASQRKQYLHLDGQPILSRTLKVFDGSHALDRLFLVVPEDEKDYCRQEIVGPARLTTAVTVVTGGRRRQDSVFNGLKAIEDPKAMVLIHDGVRPLLSEELIVSCVAGAERWGACIPALPVIDTLKETDGSGRIRKTVVREGLYAAQTPQAFKLSIILDAHEAGQAEGRQATDDASLVEAMGRPVHIIPGERENIKITTAEDLELARAYLCARRHPAKENR